MDATNRWKEGSSRMHVLHWKFSLQSRIIALVVTVVLLILLIVGYLFNAILVKSVEDSMGKNAMDVAQTIAQLPDIRQALASRNPSAYLQPRTQALKADTHADFIVITDPNGIRYTHNDTELIGKPFTGGDEGPSLQGQAYISRASGISGPSIRAFVPVESHGRLLGVIVVGMFVHHVYHVAAGYLASVVYTLSIGLGAGICLSVLLARRIKRSLHGLEPDEISSLYQERVSLLEALHEGVIAVNHDNRVSLVNESARQILSLQDDMVGKPLPELSPLSHLTRVMKSGEKELNVETTIHGVPVVVNRVPVLVNGTIVGAVSTFRDVTELRSLGEELTGAKQYVDGLRAKTHEFMNRLQTVHGLMELGEIEEAKTFVLQATETNQRLADFFSRAIQDVKISALLLAKTHVAQERHIGFQLEPGIHMGVLPADVSDSCVIILGNLIDNAFDAVQAVECPEVTVTLHEDESAWTFLVEDNGPGVPEGYESRIFERGFSTKASDRGYGLNLVYREVVDVLGGTVKLFRGDDVGASFGVSIPKFQFNQQGFRTARQGG